MHRFAVADQLVLRFHACESRPPARGARRTPDSAHGRHELDPASGNDKGLKSVSAEVLQDLEHRRGKRTGRYRPVETVSGWRAVREPVDHARCSNSSVPSSGRVSARCMILHQGLLRRRPSAALRSRLDNDACTRRAPAFATPGGSGASSPCSAVEREREAWIVHRLLRPQAAIVVEGRRSVPPAARTWADPSICHPLRTKATIDSFARPSFHEGRSSPARTDAWAAAIKAAQIIARIGEVLLYLERK